MVKFTAQEIRDIIISMFVISLAFAFIFSGRDLSLTILLIPLTFVVVGLGFVLHELAHKFVAIRYGYWAEYKMWVQGLVLALITAYFGIVFAAPGAVYIHGNYIKSSENGKISLAGPLTNIILAALFLVSASLLSSIGLARIAILGATVNSFLAVFNLVPLGIFDGAKVFRWNPIIWIVIMGVAVLLWIYTTFGISFI
ncbi:site-2 protease family protein [Methanobacterium sp. ACI-7]|uniref:site-2 protease family protein n=1 Tax=unclassified Methanobacterium TaxID=2627676 RepID=UPI0039C4408D